TSLDVHPASDLTDFFRGKNIVIINKDATVRDHIATLLIQKPLGEVWPQIKL
ncbi:MAG: NAD-dependent protein deacylase, partial [Erysipelotrichaceae bacterium]|nr:NAD-dependent protein deacylase [Erysipelotrichaceae bacterium]